MNKLIKWFKFNRPFCRTWNEYRNPFYVWWKCRKVFKFPYVHLYVGKVTWFFGMPIIRDMYNRVIDFRMSAVGWKLKYDYVVYEWDPYIVFTFFRRWQIMLIFNYVIKGDKWSSFRNSETWEAMLEIVYNKQTLDETIKRHTLQDNKELITITDNLK